MKAYFVGHLGPGRAAGTGPPWTFSVSTEEALSSGWSGEALENLL